MALIVRQLFTPTVLPTGAAGVIFRVRAIIEWCHCPRRSQPARGAYGENRLNQDRTAQKPGGV